MTENIPKYAFVVKEGEENLSPVKKTISKTMEVTESFTLFQALEYIAKLKKAKSEKEAEIAGIDSMIKAYEDEMEIIENELGVLALEKDFQKQVALDIEKSPENQAKIAELKKELVKSGNFVEKDPANVCLSREEDVECESCQG